VGFRFSFGYQRKGNAERLAALCQASGINFRSIPEFRLHDEAVSSSHLRELLKAGELERASAILGRPYGLTGTVVPGANRGAVLGFRTANLAVDNDRLLPGGVYVGRVRLADGSPGKGAVANFGVRPTFGGSGGGDTFEVHVLDFQGDLYGQKIEFEVLK